MRPGSSARLKWSTHILRDGQRWIGELRCFAAVATTEARVLTWWPLGCALEQRKKNFLNERTYKAAKIKEFVNNAQKKKKNELIALLWYNKQGSIPKSKKESSIKAFIFFSARNE